jgi:ABC-type multidrug transport system fused ATPase/permease subunit
MDIVGVIAVGLLGAISLSGNSSQNSDSRVSQALEYLNLDNSSYQHQALFLSVGACIFLVGRTILSVFFVRRILFFLSRRGASISGNLISQLLAQPLLLIQTRTTQEMLYAVTRGVHLIVLEVLATGVVMLADISLLLLMGAGLLIIDPAAAISTFILFALLGLILYFVMNVRAGRLGILSAILNIQSNEKITEVFSSYREAVVRNRRSYYALEIRKLRYQLADTSAELSFMPYVSKYLIETSVVLGAIMIGAAQYLLSDLTQAIVTLSIFLAAGSRIAPAVLRVQQGSVQIRGSLGQASPTLDLIESLKGNLLLEKNSDKIDFTHTGFEPILCLANISLTYPGSRRPALENVNLEIPSGSFLAIVGPSGAGKTTLIDVLLGILTADTGSVSISNLSPLDAISKWPGAISYVPQDIAISSGTVRENICLGFPIEIATDERINHALSVANLNEVVESLEHGSESQVGERGTKLSGGQRQRLGIARAMFTSPMLLVLDEATSSLDGDSEAMISESLGRLRGSVTVVTIAHRLSTVKNADIVVYMSEGRILKSGTFDEIRNHIPDFDRQAKLMGL